MAEPQPVEETWVFGGSRATKGGKKVYAWWDGNDELWYAAKGTFAVGSEYVVKVLRTEDEITKYGVPTYSGQHENDTLRATFEVRHRAAETQLRLAALERNDKRRSALDEAIEPLAALMRQASAFERETLMVYVMRKLTRV